jgi:hypothetical protein
VVGGAVPTNRIHTGETISSIGGGNSSAILDGCCVYDDVAFDTTLSSWKDEILVFLLQLNNPAFGTASSNHSFFNPSEKPVLGDLSKEWDLDCIDPDRSPAKKLSVDRFFSIEMCVNLRRSCPCC